MLVLRLTRFAEGNTAGEALLFQMLKACGIIRELTVEIANRIPEVGWNGLSLIHGKPILPYLLREVKGYLLKIPQDPLGPSRRAQTAEGWKGRFPVVPAS
jgi:hypothetical protein